MGVSKPPIPTFGEQIAVSQFIEIRYQRFVVFFKYLRTNRNLENNLFTSRAGLANYLRRDVFAAPEMVDDAAIDEHYRTSHLPGAHTALAAYLTGYLNHGVRNVLPRVTQRTWIAWGRHAVSPAVESGDLWLRGLPNAELDVLEACGALPHAESPAELCRKLDHFLSYNTANG